MSKDRKIKVWDLGVRMFHWLLLILLAVSVYSGFQDKFFNDFGQIHIMSGLAILTFVITRIVWGFIGSTTAKFSSFLTGPNAVIAYLKSKEKYRWVGHNPAGGWMVLLMLFLLLSQATFGLFSSDDMDFYGPLHDTLGSTFSGWAMWAHKQIWFLLALLVGFHVLAVIFTQLSKDADLIKPMITGTKGHSRESESPELRFRSFGLFCVIFVIVAAIIYVTILY